MPENRDPRHRIASAMSLASRWSARCGTRHTTEESSMRKSLSTLLILAIVLVAPLGTLTASRAIAQEPVNITMWLGAVSGSTTAECIAEHAVDAYNAMNTGTTVESTIQANNWQATQT